MRRWIRGGARSTVLGWEMGASGLHSSVRLLGTVHFLTDSRAEE